MLQKQPFKSVLRKRCSKNMQQIYRTPWQVAFNFIEIALWHGCSQVNLLHIFRTPFPKNTSGGLFLVLINSKKGVLQEYLRAMAPTVIVKRIYSQELIVRVFQYFAISRSLYKRLRIDYELQSIKSKIRIT